MWAGWQRLSREQRRTWSLVSGAIILGSVFKVFYFNFSRQLIVEDSNRSHRRGLEHLKEAKEFAEWSKKDREARLPPLTEGQRTQMREYLKIVQQHGLNMSFKDGKECLGCPVMQNRKEAAATAESN